MRCMEGVCLPLLLKRMQGGGGEEEANGMDDVGWSK